MDILISRYILEKLQDSSLFRKYENGSWYPNFDKYRLFLHKYEKNNLSFAKTIEHYRLVRKSDHIFETVMSYDLVNVSDCLEHRGKTLLSGYGTIYLPNEGREKLIVKENCYISNGFYHNTEEIALSKINNGSFVVGVCDNPNSIFYKENEERLYHLEKILRKGHVDFRCYSHKNHRDKCLILAYRAADM